MQSSIKNQRSSPIRPFLRISARQALSFGLLAFHLARISSSFCVVSFFESVVVVDGVCAVAGIGKAMAGIAANAKAVMNARAQDMDSLQGVKGFTNRTLAGLGVRNREMDLATRLQS